MARKTDPLNPQRGVLYIVLAYCGFAALWILFSDWLIAIVFTDPAQLLQVSVAKGWVFVGVTGLLLYGLLRRLVGRLAAALQRERTVLAEKNHASQLLRQRNEELEALMDSLPTAVFIAQDAACGRITGNRAANEIFRVQAGTNVSASAEPASSEMSYRVLEAEGGRELAPEELPMQRAALSAKPIKDMEFYLCLSDGQGLWLQGGAIPLFDAQGAVRGAVGVFSDITERKAAQRSLESHKDRLEAAVAGRTAELVRANDQLKAFTYAASHDLKTPLRGISSFLTLLERSCRERLGGEELRFLNIIQANAARMTILIDDLMAYAQQEQKAMVAEPVDLAATVGRILDERKEEIRRRGVQVHVHLPGVAVRADPSGFAQVVRNLIDNALKYSEKADAPILEIGGEVLGDQCRFWFRDNGIGFDMVYHEKIFEIFRRLHAYSEIPGSGVGLALVKKAMERMRGRVWAESELGRGATFFLEIPVA